MQKNKLLIITFIVFLFCFIPKVDAVLCTRGEYSNLKSLAFEAEASYELKFDKDNNHYYQITIKNVNKDIMVKFNGTFYEPENGTITISDRIVGGADYDINLYGGYNTECVEEFLYGTTIQIPKYNVYSEKDECIEYEEFYMCNKWYQGEIRSDAHFDEELNKYIQSLEKKESEEKITKEKSFFQKVIDFYTDNLKITLPITILIVLLIVYKIVVSIIKRKNRIKLD